MDLPPQRLEPQLLRFPGCFLGDTLDGGRGRGGLLRRTARGGFRGGGRRLLAIGQGRCVGRRGSGRGAGATCQFRRFFLEYLPRLPSQLVGQLVGLGLGGDRKVVIINGDMLL